MKIIDKYTLKQVITSFILVLCSMTILVWLTQSLRMLNMIVTNGVSVWVFLKLTVLVLPNFLQFLSPLVLFAVALFTLIRMQADKELMVMKAVGMTTRQIMRPIFLFGLILTVIGYFLSLVIIPNSITELREMKWKIKNDLSHVFLQEGQFNSVGNGQTVYVKERLADGHIQGIFAYDTKNPEKYVIYAAKDGILYQEPDGIKAELHDGVQQIYYPVTKRFSITKFGQQVMTFGDNGNGKTRSATLGELSMRQLLMTSKADLNQNVALWRKYKVEAIKRLIQPLYNITFLFFVVFGVLMGYYNRRGQVSRINVTVGLALLVQSGSLMFEYLSNKNLWFLILMIGNVFIPVLIIYPNVLKKIKWFQKIGLMLALICAGEVMAAGLKMGEVNPKAPVDFEADSVSYNQKNGEMNASGNVVLKQENTTVKTDQIIYNQKQDKISFPNPMTISRTDGTVAHSSGGEMDSRMTTVKLGKTDTRFYEGTRLGAEQLRREPDGNSYLDEATYTPCDVCEGKSPLWQLRAKVVKHDAEAQDMIYKHAFFDVKDIPVFYIPYFRTPDMSVKRRSGFLPPKFYSIKEMRNGVEIPYFINVADNQNLLVTPVFAPAHVPLGLLNYKGAFSAGAVNLQASATKDKDKGKHNQGHIKMDMAYDLSDHWKLDGRLFRASTDTYFRKYQLDNIDDTEPFLTSDLTVQRFGNRNYLKMKGYSFQSLQDGVSSHSIPVILPTVDFKYNTQVLNGTGAYAYSEANSALYNTREHFKSNRLSVTQGVVVPYVSSVGAAMEMRGYVRFDGYNVDKGDTQADSHQYDTSRFYPNLSATVRYPFVQNDADQTQVIEPIVMAVVASNNSNSDDIPNVDSLVFDFDDTDLFSTNRFSGYDRVEPGTRVNYGVKWSQFHHQSGRTISALVGQSYRFNEDELMSELMGYGRHYSDYVGRVQISMPFWSVLYRARLSQKNFHAEKNEIGFNVGSAPLKFGVNYVLRKAYKIGDNQYGASKEITYNVSSQLTKSFQASGYYQYDLSGDGEPVKAGGSLRYDNECTAVIFNIEKSYTEDRDYKGGISFMAKLVLKTLGEI